MKWLVLILCVLTYPAVAMNPAYDYSSDDDVIALQRMEAGTSGTYTILVELEYEYAKELHHHTDCCHVPSSFVTGFRQLKDTLESLESIASTRHITYADPTIHLFTDMPHNTLRLLERAPGVKKVSTLEKNMGHSYDRGLRRLDTIEAKVDRAIRSVFGLALGISVMQSFLMYIHSNTCQ